MFIVGKSFFSETLSKFNIKTIAPLCVIHIPLKMLAVGPLGPQYNLLFAWYELGRHGASGYQIGTPGLGCLQDRSSVKKKKKCSKKVSQEN